MTTTRAKEIQIGQDVAFTTGGKAKVVGRFGTGDGTITLIFKRGDLVWKRRVARDMQLEVTR